MSRFQVRELTVTFGHGPEAVRAVDGLSVDIDQSEVVGMVGESGSGKSVAGLAMMGLLPSAGISVSGSVQLDGRELLTLSEPEMRGVRGRQMAMIFQEPMAALDPVFSVGSQIAEVVRTHENAGRDRAKRQAIEMLGHVGIADPARRFHAFPHQLSGGMRQRAMIAMALVCEPAVLIADEPTTALDVTIESQIVTLLRDLNERIGTAILLISHDFGVIARMCDRVVTLYLGQQVEGGQMDDILTHPRHPYTSALIQSLPRIDMRDQRLGVIPGHMPSPANVPSGCRFRTRCAHALDRCATEQQPLVEIEQGQTRCWRHDELALPGVFPTTNHPAPPLEMTVGTSGTDPDDGGEP